MHLKIEYKVITPCITFKSSVKYCLVKYTLRPLHYRYLFVSNNLKIKYKNPEYFFITKKSHAFYHTLDVDLSLQYNNNQKYFIIFKNIIYVKKFNLQLFHTRFTNQLNLNDYFFTRNISRSLDVKINIYTKKEKAIKKEINLHLDFTPPRKYLLFILKTLSSSSSQEILLKRCIFNFKNVKGNEDVYLYIKDNHNLIEVEEESNMVLIIDDCILYYQNNKDNLQDLSYVMKKEYIFKPIEMFSYQNI